MTQAVEKGICFRLGGERYIHPLSSVKEVLSYQSPAPVPGAGLGVEGIIDVRGHMVTVLYGTHLLNLNPDECEEEGHIIVLDLPAGYFGIRVEGVERVMDLPENNDDHGLEYRDNGCIQGTIQHDDELYILVEFNDYCSALD
ncbi:chemotaxis protein CheW [Marinomonas sp. M1K-6]|uniref:Chemotaxis protein CheW n=1 Tax=Marinomonas profundi TaxID=2726122 RepID=A0A847RF99_9GAMM|nr:chemotaxis protein CheW [Marinomonas profundi]NLQ18940.1 chemotaxis protein CheW [Marinomonas profundi]UDV02321.1 chemotaxis protein CheW [Marinomonas profundi]